MEKLIAGYRAFRRDYYAENRDLFDQLARRQNPRAMVVACCDSRVDPALIFNAVPGEIFTLRNVANLVPPYGPDQHYHGTSAALEFAVRSLEVEHIIVLGHASCGGVRALLAHQEGDFIGPWMRMAEPARRASLAKVGNDDPERLQLLCEHETLKISLNNLRSFPWIAERLAAGKLQLHGWYFDIEKGELQILDQDSGEFRPAV